MAKSVLRPSATNVVSEIFIQDSSATTGVGLTGLVYNTASLTCYYKKDNGTGSVSVTLADITTLGTYASGGFKAVDGTNMPGVYEFHPPNAAFDSSAKMVTFILKGAANMAPVLLEYQLDEQNADGVWAKTLTELSSVPGVTGTVKDALNWVFTLARNKRTQTSTTETVLKDDGSTTLATSTKSDDGTTFTRGEYS